MSMVYKTINKILDEITEFCGNECSNVTCCPEYECVLYRIEQLVEEIIKECNDTVPVVTDKFFVMPKPKKPLISMFERKGPDSIYCDYMPDMCAISEYAQDMIHYKSGKAVAKALAEEYGFEVNEVNGD